MIFSSTKKKMSESTSSHPKNPPDTISPHGCERSVSVSSVCPNVQLYERRAPDWRLEKAGRHHFPDKWSEIGSYTCHKHDAWATKLVSVPRLWARRKKIERCASVEIAPESSLRLLFFFKHSADILPRITVYISPALQILRQGNKYISNELLFWNIKIYYGTLEFSILIGP